MENYKKKQKPFFVKRIFINALIFSLYASLHSAFLLEYTNGSQTKKMLLLK